ncbi:SGF29 tudor-like domain-containing protein [Lipomyces japonicus]|uniref:SGF29 tudor-like domain-containing protein n=1 Tax=Lipomyces japonicus TaxID=56871 RepID=UPI0034CF6754
MATRMRSRPSSQKFVPMLPESNGEAEVWNKISADLRKLPDHANLNESVQVSITKLEALLGNDDSDHGVKLENEDDLNTKLATLDQLKNLYLRQLEYAQTEKKILDQSSEDVSILIALRQASEQAPPSDGKRKKRKVEEVAPESKNLKKARSGSALPLEALPIKGAQVAFRLKKQKGTDVEWIQCEITKVMGEGNKVRYEVQDPEPDENNNPGQSYKAGPKDIIVIAESSTELPPYAPGTRVLARYPETTTFYRAEVTGTRRAGTCRLKFEGEEEVGKETEVERRLVLEYPR